MNLSTVALVLLAWHLLQKKPTAQQQPQQLGIGDFLSDDVKNILNTAQKLNGSCSPEDRAGAIFEIMSNPAVQNIANTIFGNMGAKNAKPQTPEPAQQQCESDQNTNGEGYKFETPSAASQEFFRPIDNIADAEVKHKLYRFYDNWYVK